MDQRPAEHQANDAAQTNPRKQVRRKRDWRWWLHWMAIGLLGLPLLPYTGFLAPLFSPSVYPKLAPAGWHNITPHGNSVFNSVAFSTETPGLGFACGSLFTVDWHAPLRWSKLHIWRTRDGGATWEQVYPSFLQDQEFCDASMPPDGKGTIEITLTKDDTWNSPHATWVSRDFGQKWVRDDTPYWPTPNTQPDLLQKEGWTESAVVQDSSAPNWWYRDLTMDKQIPVLEHSTDNGATWTVIGPIGSLPDVHYDLATTPGLPGYVCAGVTSPDTQSIVLMSSADGGKTWSDGTMPSSPANPHGETGTRITMGSNGDCYLGLHYGIGSEPGAGKSHVGFFQLTHGSSTMKYIDIPADEVGFQAMEGRYIPAGNGMSARLVVHAWVHTSSWASVFSRLAADNDQDLVIWHAVP